MKLFFEKVMFQEYNISFKFRILEIEWHKHLLLIFFRILS